MTFTEVPKSLPLVSRFEYDLLRILQFLLGRAPADQAERLLTNRRLPPPRCLSAGCVRLVEDTLAKGLILVLVRGGGWRRERFIRGDGAAIGRVWERHPLELRRLELGPHPLAFLIWLTAENPTKSSEPWDAPTDEMTAADELFFAIAYNRLRQLRDLITIFAQLAVFHRNGLCWLTHPADFRRGESYAPPPFDHWTEGQRSVFLECLQPLLSSLWIRSEREKGRITSWTRMNRQGGAELATLTAFLASLEKAKRPDLARFVLTAAASTLHRPGIGPEIWLASLKEDRPARLEDRIETQRLALAVPRQLETLQRWERQARTVGYWDEGYEASQVWKADWEAVDGDEIAARAMQILRQVEPLRTESFGIDTDYRAQHDTEGAT